MYIGQAGAPSQPSAIKLRIAVLTSFHISASLGPGGVEAKKRVWVHGAETTPCKEPEAGRIPGFLLEYCGRWLCVEDERLFVCSDRQV